MSNTLKNALISYQNENEGIFNIYTEKAKLKNHFFSFIFITNIGEINADKTTSIHVFPVKML